MHFLLVTTYTVYKTVDIKLFGKRRMKLESGTTSMTRLMFFVGQFLCALIFFTTGAWTADTNGNTNDNTIPGHIVPDVPTDDKTILRYIIPDVPYVQQSHPNTCGAAALSMLLQYHGKKVTEKDLLQTYPMMKQTGFYIPWLWEYSQKSGLETVSGTGNIHEIKKWLKQDTPVIVYQHCTSNNRRQHFRVVVGHDDKENFFVVWDSAPQLGKHHKIDYKTFMDLWSLPYYRDASGSRSHFYFVIKPALRSTTGLTNDSE